MTEDRPAARPTTTKGGCKIEGCSDQQPPRGNRSVATNDAGKTLVPRVFDGDLVINDDCCCWDDGDDGRRVNDLLDGWSKAVVVIHYVDNGLRLTSRAQVAHELAGAGQVT